jgi:phosphatidylinositol alpha-mannosyltransferase
MLSYVRIKKILQQEAFDVIHLQEPLTPSITWWALMNARVLPRAVTIGTFHAYHDQPNWFYRQGRPIFRKMFARLHSRIAVSQAAYHFACQMFPGEYHIIPNGIDLNRFSSTVVKSSTVGSAEPSSIVKILFVGRLDKRKGFLTLLESFIKLKPDYPQLQLQVIGPFGPKDCRSYQKVARAHGVANIDFVGYVSPERLPSYYHQADIFCAPSTGFESFGIVLLEAMAAGLPIVASRIAGYRSLVTEGLEGLLVPPGRSNLLAGALRQLIDHPGQRQRMGRFGRTKASQYSWESIVDKTLKVYVDTLHSRLEPQPGMFHQTECTELKRPYSTEAA